MSLQKIGFLVFALLWAAAEGARAEEARTAAPKAAGALGVIEIQAATGLRTFVYRCGACAAEPFEFTIRLGPGELALWLPRRFGYPYQVLSQEYDTEETRFREQNVVLILSADSARLEVDGQVFSGCEVDLARSAWKHARLSGVDFRALGRDPEWTLELRAEDKMSFVLAGDGRRVRVNTPEPAVDADRRHAVYLANAGADRLTVTIEGQRCSDPATGEVFESTVTVSLNGIQYRGCGRALH